MNRKQYFVLAWSFMLIGMMFIGIDTMYTHTLNTALEIDTLQIMSGINEPADIGTIWIVVNAEIYEPFIYLSYVLFVVFMILGFMEKKK